MDYNRAKELISKYGANWADHVNDQPAPYIPPRSNVIPLSSLIPQRVRRPREPLTNDDLRRLTPSVFALEPWQEMSDHYRFVPTIKVIDSLRNAGFFPVSAIQSNSRIEGKREFTKHMLRFRNSNTLLNVGEVIPEIGLINSHDGTSSYKLFLGLFRCVCSNQLVISSATLFSIRVTHRGDRNLCQDIIDTSARVLGESPKTLDKVNQWQQITLQPQEQLAFSTSALELNDTTLAIRPDSLLRARRREDMAKEDGTRSLWGTMNIIQENLIKGGLLARSTNNRLIHTRAIKSVDRDVKINRGLWTLTEEMAKIKNK